MTEEESKEGYHTCTFDKTKPSVYKMNINMVALTYQDGVRYLEKVLEDVKKQSMVAESSHPCDELPYYPCRNINIYWSNITEEENKVIEKRELAS